MSQKPYVLERIDIAWRLWLHAIEGLGEAQCHESINGEWTVKDLFGHTAFWDNHALESATVRSAGGEMEPFDFQTLNAAEHAANQDIAYEEQREKMYGTHQTLMKALEAMEEVEGSWVDDDTYLHYMEHALQVLDWRKQSIV